MDKLFHPLYGYPLAALEFTRGLVRSLGQLRLDHQPTAGGVIPRDFFGVNVAPGDDPQTDDYLLARLQELGLRQVRMDFSYDSPGGPAERLLRRLLEAGLEVMLNLLPPLPEAEDMGSGLVPCP